MKTASIGKTKNGFRKSATKGRTPKVTKNVAKVKGTRSVGSVKGIKKGLNLKKGRTLVNRPKKVKVSGDSMSTVMKDSQRAAVDNPSLQRGVRDPKGGSPLDYSITVKVPTRNPGPMPLQQGRSGFNKG